MNARDELIARLARRRAEKLGGLTEGGYHELELAVRENPEPFVEDPADDAFYRVVRALERHDAACEHEDLLDDDAYMAARSKRLGRLAADCEAAFAVDPSCLDAALLHTLACDLDSDRLLNALFELEETLVPWEEDDAHDAWDDLTLRPRLRLEAAMARTCLDTARYRMAAELGEGLLRRAPSDALGVRHTCDLAYARLEDEPAFEALDQRFARRGDSWNHLARTILLYKLGRMGAAKRALEGYARLCEGGAYALLRPMLVDVYLPDRPEVRPFSFEEATMAVHEADPIIVDVPDFVTWAQSQRTVYFAAQDFARRNDLDW